MTPDAAATAMRQKADALLTERARLQGVMRAILDMTDIHGVRAILNTEFQRLPGAGANDNKDWIG